MSPSKKMAHPIFIVEGHGTHSIRCLGCSVVSVSPCYLLQGRDVGLSSMRSDAIFFVYCIGDLRSGGASALKAPR